MHHEFESNTTKIVSITIPCFTALVFFIIIENVYVEQTFVPYVYNVTYSSAVYNFIFDLYCSKRISLLSYSKGVYCCVSYLIYIVILKKIELSSKLVLQFSLPSFFGHGYFKQNIERIKR